MNNNEYIIRRMVLHELCTPRRMFIGRSRVELIRILYDICTDWDLPYYEIAKKVLEELKKE